MFDVFPLLWHLSALGRLLLLDGCIGGRYSLLALFIFPGLAYEFSVFGSADGSYYLVLGIAVPHRDGSSVQFVCPWLAALVEGSALIAFFKIPRGDT